MSGRLLGKREGFAAVLGITDGMLTALTLASGRIVQSPGGLSLSLAVRVAAASALAGVVVFFTAELARRNQGLVHAEQQLSLLSHGKLATTRLGQIVFVESSRSALTVMSANFLGALIPFLVGMTIRRFAWTPICFTVLSLGALGAMIAKETYRSKTLWAAGLMAAGVALAGLGIWLRIV